MKRKIGISVREYLFIVGISVILGFIFEGLLIRNSELIYDYSGREDISLIYPNLSQEMIPVSYEKVDGNTFVPLNEDPQMIFTSLNTHVDGILIDLEKPLENDTVVQIYYATNEHYFSEEYVVADIYEAKSHQIYVDIPAIYCTTLRIDINGTVCINEILTMENDSVNEYSARSRSFKLSDVLLITSILSVVLFFVEKYIKEDKNAYSLTKIEWLYCIVCFCFYFVWSISKALNYGPDEFMRYDVSLFFYNNNRLPKGIETINDLWGFSYAHLPTMLCNILSYVPMKIMGHFTQDSFMLLIAARAVSVFCGTGTIYYVIKIAKRMIKSPVRWIMVVFVSMLPQYVFLCSYVNNDIIALFGSAMILYSWIVAVEERWNYKNAIVLSVGIVVCALSYYNSYGWILASIIFFVLSYLKQNGNDYKSMLRLGVFISIIVLLGISYMFIRHLVLYDDLLGMNTVREYGELYGADYLKQSQRVTVKGLGVSLWDMLVGRYEWLKYTYQSAIGVFSYMNVYVSKYIYYVYAMLLVIGCIGALGKCISVLKRKTADSIKILFYFCNVLNIVIPIALSVYNSYCFDFQPQGRYCYPGILAVALLLAKGMEYLLDHVKSRERVCTIVGVFAGTFITITGSVFFTVYLPS